MVSPNKIGEAQNSWQEQTEELLRQFHIPSDRSRSSLSSAGVCWETIAESLDSREPGAIQVHNPQHTKFHGHHHLQPVHDVRSVASSR